MKSKGAAEIQKLRKALKDANKYFDTVINNIPNISKESNALIKENKRLLEEVSIYEGIREEALKIFSTHEFPGPFTMAKGSLNDFSISDRNRTVVLRSGNETIANFTLNFLNRLSDDISRSN